MQILEHYSPEADVVLYSGDCLGLLSEIPLGSASLILTSPPYNIGKSYEEKKTLKAYLEEQDIVITESVKRLKEGGSICWQVGNYVAGPQEVYPLDIALYPYFAKHDLKLRNRIIWRFEHGLHSSKRFSGRYETILWFTKGDKYTFNMDPIRVPQKYPGKRFAKGSKREGQPSGNPLGKNPGDIWYDPAPEWASGVWDIPNVKWNHLEKTIHPAQFPIELAERLVLALTSQKDRIVDPYMGVGSTILAAALHGRIGIGSDIEEQYVGLARERIDALQKGKLRKRALGAIKYVPDGSEKAAQRPVEWDMHVA